MQRVVRRSVWMLVVLATVVAVVPAIVLADCEGEACGRTADPWSAVGPLLFGLVVVAMAVGMAVSEARARRP